MLRELRNPPVAGATSISTIRQLSRDAGLDLERSQASSERGIAHCNRIIAEFLDFAQAKGLQREAIRFDEWLSAVPSNHKFPERSSVTIAPGIADVTDSFHHEDFRRATPSMSWIIPASLRSASMATIRRPLPRLKSPHK